MVSPSLARTPTGYTEKKPHHFKLKYRLDGHPSVEQLCKHCHRTTSKVTTDKTAKTLDTRTRCGCDALALAAEQKKRATAPGAETSGASGSTEAGPSKKPRTQDGQATFLEKFGVKKNDTISS